MRNFQSIVCFAMAVGAAFLGATGRDFYGGGIGRLATRNKIPKWFGRLWFFGFSIVMLYLGFSEWR